MENPQNQEGKKPFPWGWVAAGCGLIGVLMIVSLVLIVIALVPAAQNAIGNFGPLLKSLPVPLLGSTATPNPGPGNGTSVGNLPFKFNSIQDPTGLVDQSLMDQMISSLNLNNDTDFMAPKSYTGSASLDPTTSFTLGNGWCAKDSTTLQQNLANIHYQLSINGTDIDLSEYPTLQFTDNRGDACAETGISITPSGTLSRSYHFVLIQKFSSSLSDGITPSPYPAGDVRFDFSIQFRSSSNPGQSS